MDFKVHRINFMEWKPLPISCLAYDKASQRLAVSRSDGSIEIWSEPDNWFKEKVIAVADKISVEDVTWVQSRLFSVGFDSHLTEYDLQSLNIKRQVSAHASEIWCVCKNEQQQKLAVGTEQGCVVLFDIANDRVEYLRSFDRLEGRIMCIAWHTQEGVIVTGGFQNLRIWSVKSGHALQRIVVGNEDTLVWCIAVTRDLTIISGDSRGKVSFFNGKQGTRITHFQSHLADVETLCLDETETNVFCAGVDPKVVQFSYIPPSDDSGWRTWVRSSVRGYHTHDVHASVVVGNTIVTGGVDTNLLISQISGNKKGFLRIPAVPSAPVVSVAKEAELVVFNYPTCLEIWRLGNTEAPATSMEDVLPLTYGNMKLVKLVAEKGERICCSTISPDGTLVAFSDQKKLRMHKLTMTDVKSLSPKVQMSRFSLPSADNQHSVHQLAITPDNRRLVAATSAPSLQIWDISGDKGRLLHTVLLQGSGDELLTLWMLSAEGEVSRHSFTNLCVSDNSKMASTSDSGGNVHLCRLSDGQVMCRLPKLAHQATALAFTPAARSLLVTYSDHRVMEFDVHKEEYTAWSRGAHFPDQWLQQRGCIHGIMCRPASPNTLVLHSEHNLLFIDRSQPMPDRKYPLFKGQNAKDRDTPRPLIAAHKYRFILHMEMLDADTMVIVEQTPLSILDSLPPALQTKKYGT